MKAVRTLYLAKPPQHQVPIKQTFLKLISATGVAQPAPPSLTPQATTIAKQAAAPTQGPANGAAIVSDSCTDGTLVCSADGTMFSMCVGGKMTIPQPVAPGTACRDGAIGYAKFIRRRPLWN